MTFIKVLCENMFGWYSLLVCAVPSAGTRVFVEHSAVYSARGAHNSYVHMITRPPFVHTQGPGTIVQIRSSDSAAAAALSEAAWLWNTYYPMYSGKPTYLEGRAALAYDAANKIGEATCIDNADNKTCMLSVLLAAPRRMFDVFVHEIGHAIIPWNATSGDRKIDDTGHWVPSEGGEILGHEVSHMPHMALYTALAPNASHSTACMTRDQCAPGRTCAPIPGVYNVPWVCVHRQPYMYRAAPYLTIAVVGVVFTAVVCAL